MAEPTTSTAASVGLLALLIGAFGNVAASVMMVVIAAIAGCYLSISSLAISSVSQVLKYMTVSILVSLVLSWGGASLLIGFYPQADSPYTPSIIALMIGFLNNRFAPIINAILKSIGSKFGINIE